ncbi:hypothetical protein HB774_00035 [Rhizobium leguminosarum bv. viciae]|nr:hypothetical protein HB774_00035 [Rhizobium leguminosarum bv. viciae]
MYLKRRRLMARRLADHDGLDQIAHDGHQPLLGLFIGIVASEEDELADDDLHISGIELRLELGDLLLKILHRLCQCIQLRRQLLARRFQFVQLIVERGEARAAFRSSIADLLDDAVLALGGCLQRGRQLIPLGRRLLQEVDLMRNHPLRNAIENLHRVERHRNAVQDPLFELVTSDCLTVGAAGAVERLDRQALLAVGAAIAVLAGDRIGTAAFGAFQYAAQEIFRALGRVKPVRLGALIEVTDLGVARAGTGPKVIADDAHCRNVFRDPLVGVVHPGRAPFRVRIFV